MYRRMYTIRLILNASMHARTHARVVFNRRSYLTITRWWQAGCATAATTLLLTLIDLHCSWHHAIAGWDCKDDRYRHEAGEKSI